MDPFSKQEHGGVTVKGGKTYNIIKHIKKTAKLTNVHASSILDKNQISIDNQQ